LESYVTAKPARLFEESEANTIFIIPVVEVIGGGIRDPLIGLPGSSEVDTQVGVVHEKNRIKSKLASVLIRINVSTTLVAKFGAIIQEHTWLNRYGSFENDPAFLVRDIPLARQLGIDGKTAH
jgi:hypothetical protein